MWEGGSVANKTNDQFSDIDVTIIARDSVETLFQSIEATLDRTFKISHRYVEPKCFWPGCYQRVYFLEGAPKHFFVDIAVFLESSQDVLSEFMQSDRHGNPVIYFDKVNIIKPQASDPVALKSQHLRRLKEIEAAYPIFKLEVFKELDRGHSIDAFGFYFGGVLRPLVELMGILHRPYRYDFGLRYLHKTFPEHDQKAIERFLYVRDAAELRDRMTEADRFFTLISHQVRQKLDV
jgi:hypothetical protein